MGRPSIAPEMPLRAMLLQAFYSVCSEEINLRPSMLETALL
jgi:transposase